MKFLRANHVIASDDKTITFGIDANGDVWLATNTGSLNPDVTPEYFKLSAITFSEYVASLVQLAIAALRFKLTGYVHGTLPDYNADGVVIAETTIEMDNE